MEAFLGLLALVLIVGGFIFAENYRHLKKEYYFLKNFKLKIENPDIEVSSLNGDGEYFISYQHGDKRIYEFFKTSYEQKKAIKSLKANVEMLQHGKRLSDLPIDG
jgi:hypothetical protein